MTNRKYFETESQAESHLIDMGYDFGGDQGGRYAWTKRNGGQGADIRFNSIGYFIKYSDDD